MRQLLDGKGFATRREYSDAEVKQIPAAWTSVPVSSHVII